jgi:transcriptional regulator NrdR family protein
MGFISVEQIAPTMMKQIKPSSMGSTVAEALINNDRVAMIRGAPSVQGLAEYMELWDEVQGMQIDNDIPDHISWRLANDDAYSAK